MGSAPVGNTLSVRQLLFPSDTAGKDAVDKHLDVVVTWPAVPVSREKVIEAVLKVLDIPLTDLIFRAWESYSEIRKAMADTRGHTVVPRHVLVGGHTLTSIHHPVVDCYLENEKLFDIPLDLELSLRFDGVDVRVDAGEIVAIGPGDAVATASLQVKGVTLATSPEVRLSFPEPILSRTAHVAA